MKLKNGQDLIVRSASVSDASQILEYMACVNSESKNLLREPEEFTMTLEQEEAFLETTLASPNSMMLCGIIDDKIVSVVGFKGQNLSRIKHRASIGMSVLKAYNSLGIGSCMMEAIIDNAKRLGLKKLDLDVRVDNKNAIRLYEKYDFKYEGTIRMGMYVDNKYIDLQVMGKILED